LKIHAIALAAIALLLDFLSDNRHLPPLFLPHADGISATTLRNPMRIASHIATALSAAAAGSNRPSDWQLVGASMAYLGSFRTIDRAGQGSRPISE